MREGTRRRREAEGYFARREVRHENVFKLFCYDQNIIKDDYRKQGDDPVTKFYPRTLN